MLHRHRRLSLALAVLLMTLAGPRAVPAQEQDSLIAHHNDFALALYQLLGKEQRAENLFFSPYSILSALAMTMEGARGETAQQMGTVLRLPRTAQRQGSEASALPWDTSLLHTSLARLRQRLQTTTDAAPTAAPASPGQPYDLRIANALWGEHTFPLRQPFVDTLAQVYGAAALSADFLRHPEEERQRINQWVSEQTQARIPDFFPPGSLPSDTLLVLVNAIAFHGNWVHAFAKGQTQAEAFTRQDGSQSAAMLMTTQTTLRYAEVSLPAARPDAPPPAGDTSPPQAPGIQVLELPYQGDALAMVLLLPQHPHDLPALEAQLTAETLSAWLAMLQPQKVKVFLPKYRLETTYELTTLLATMGMPAAFAPGGFTGISDAPDAARLCISKVLHKTFVDVHEEGTEAAAATGVMARSLAAVPPVPVFRADHPFVFLIRDLQSGMIFFMGLLAHPS